MCLQLIAGKDGVCSTMRFANNPDEVIINEAPGRGPLADALLVFWGK